jgi:hypothetical protein
VLLAGCGRLGFGGLGTGGDTPDSSAVAMAPTQNLIAYWPFDSIVGNAADDMVGGNSATCFGGTACPALAPGIVGNAAVFDGAANMCLDVASLNAWSATAFTISAWVKSAALDGPVVVHEGYSGCPSPLMSTKLDHVGLTQLNTTTAHNEAWTTAPVIAPGEWHHVAVWWDGTTQAVFVDGMCSCNTVPANQPALYIDEFSIGCYPHASTYFSGEIDEVRIYDRALGIDEMTMLVTSAGQPAPPITDCTQACAVTTP